MIELMNKYALIIAFLILHFRIKQTHPIIGSAGPLKPFLPSSTFSALKTVAQRNRKEVYSQQSAPKENCTISSAEQAQRHSPTSAIG